MRLRYVQSKPLELDAGVNLRSKSDFIMSPALKTATHRQPVIRGLALC
jgi:hypothetical protein